MLVVDPNLVIKVISYYLQDSSFALLREYRKHIGVQIPT